MPLMVLPMDVNDSEGSKGCPVSRAMAVCCAQVVYSMMRLRSLALMMGSPLEFFSGCHSSPPLRVSAS